METDPKDKAPIGVAGVVDAILEAKKAAAVLVRAGAKVVAVAVAKAKVNVVGVVVAGAAVKAGNGSPNTKPSHASTIRWSFPG